MKFDSLFALIFSVLSVVAYAADFSAADQEIFDVQEKLVADSNRDDYDFYRFLRLPKGPSSKSSEIEKHYRQMSRKWHPDKFRDPKTKHRAEKRFQELSLVMSILRDHEKKKRYDYYLQRGFPKYNKETGRYMFGRRFRPTFVMTIGVVVIIASVLQYLVLRINNLQSYKRKEGLISEIRSKSLDSANGDPTDFGAKMVLHKDKLFLVKPDRTVWYYDGPFETDEDRQNAVKDIRETFSIGLNREAVHENRKQRRAASKKKVEKEDDESNIPLLEVTSADVSPVRLSSLLIVKVFTVPYTIIASLLKRDAPEEKPKKIDLADSTTGNIKLPNGKILSKRQR